MEFNNGEWDQNFSILTDKDRDLVVRMLDTDCEPDEGLIEAAQIHAELIIE